MRHRMTLRFSAALMGLGVIIFAATSTPSMPLPANVPAAFHVEQPPGQTHPEGNQALGQWMIQFTNYINAVEANQYEQAVAAQQQAAAQAAATAAANAAAAARAASTPTYSSPSPGGWQAVAMCEEGGANDPNYGYYGIKEWNGFGGYPTAGSAPQSVQLQWEAQNVGQPPDESGGCHSY